MLLLACFLQLFVVGCCCSLMCSRLCFLSFGDADVVAAVAAVVVVGVDVVVILVVGVGGDVVAVVIAAVRC